MKTTLLLSIATLAVATNSFAMNSPHLGDKREYENICGEKYFGNDKRTKLNSYISENSNANSKDEALEKRTLMDVSGDIEYGDSKRQKHQHSSPDNLSKEEQMLASWTPPKDFATRPLENYFRQEALKRAVESATAYYQTFVLPALEKNHDYTKIKYIPEGFFKTALCLIHVDSYLNNLNNPVYTNIRSITFQQDMKLNFLSQVLMEISKWKKGMFKSIDFSQISFGKSDINYKQELYYMLPLIEVMARKQIEELDLTFLGLTKIPDSLFWLKNLKSLTIKAGNNLPEAEFSRLSDHKIIYDQREEQIELRTTGYYYLPPKEPPFPGSWYGDTASYCSINT